MTTKPETRRDRFLKLLVDRLTMPVSVSSAQDVTSMLEDLAHVLDTTGAYVIMLARDPSGETTIEARHAWYEFDVAPLEVTSELLAELEPVFRQGPLIVADSRQLPPEAHAMRDALESRGLRSALMQPVFFDDVIRGFVGFNHRRPRDWSDSEREVAKQLARMVVGTLDKQAADRDLAEAEARIRSFVTASPMPVYCWEFPEPIPTDLAVDQQLAAINSGVLVECNDEFARSYGLGSVDQAVGTRFGDMPILDAEWVRSALRRFIEDGYRSVEQQAEADLPDGRHQVVVVNATGFVDDRKLHRIWGHVRDVTALVDAEREIEAGRARVNLAVQGGGLGFFDWRPDAATGSFEFAAGLADRLHRRVTVEGRDELRRLLGTDNADTLIAAWTTAGGPSSDRTAAEITLPVGDETHHLLFQGSSGAADSGRTGHIVGVIQDLTAVRRAEADQAELEERMRAAQKLESLGMLAGGIAHDFNNLLFAIRGHAELATDGMPAGASGRHHLAEIETAVGVASELCRQLLVYAGRRDLVLEAVDVNALIRDIRGLLDSLTCRGTAMRFDFGDSPEIVGDASQVQQVVLNLVINAAEAIGDETGTIGVSTGYATHQDDELAEPYLDHDLPSGVYTFVEVTDSGSGMNEETRARMFDPFFTTKFTGRGLGMSAVLGIVRSHAGSIKVSTEPGRGTTVRVLFPVTSDNTATGPVGHDPEPSRSLAGRTVLFVDDDDLVRSVGQAILERMGLTVLCADGGAEAIELFDVHANHIAAVVLDLTMPEMDGVETFRALRRRKHDVQVVLTSGYGEQEATRHFVGDGLAAFLQKPFSADDLHQTLESLIAV